MVMTIDIERRAASAPAGFWRRAMVGSGVLVLALFGAACSTPGGGGGAQPDWVDGPAAQYPAGQFLLGRGNGDSVELAQERARADLAKIFEVSIAVEASDTQRAKGEGGVMRYEAASEQRIVTRTEKVISGLRIAELWKAPAMEPGGGRQHALAVLPRLQAGMALRQEIAARDEAIRQEVSRARAASDALERAGLASRALALARQRAGFEQSLRVVDLGGRGVDTEFSVSRLQADLDEQLSRLALVPFLEASGPLDETSLWPLIKGVIAESGFRNREVAGVTTSYQLKLRTRFNEQYLEGWHWLRGNLELSLVDAAGRVRGSTAWPIKVSAQEASAARSRIVLEIEGLLKRELRPAILGFVAP
jgi:hypothetical protein